MTAPATPPPTYPGPRPARARWSSPVGLGVTIGLGTVVAAAALAVALPNGGATMAQRLVVGLLLLAVSGLVLHRFPWLAPWGALAIFSTSAELRLRLDPGLGAIKDVFVTLLLALLVVHVVRRPSVLERVRQLAGPLASIGLVVGMYLLDPAGGHGSAWIFGTRLLLEVLALMLLGMLCAEPRRTTEHLVRAMAVLLPFEAVFAWFQHWVGADALVFVWGYQYGAQVRVTSGGGLRTSGTFEDPFQLAALAVLGVALALFVASRRQAVVILVSAVAVLGATSVRTALIQVGLLLVVFAVRRGWWRQALALGGVAGLAGIFLLATTTTAVRPGAPEEPLLLNLNGRSTAWAQAVPNWQAFVAGSGVGARGIGSTRVATLVSAPPAYDPNTEPEAEFAGDPAFLDSAYAQVQSDVGIVGSVALVAGLVGFAVVLGRRCRSQARHGAAWAAFAVLAVSMLDWIGRSSMASYTTGFLTLYVLGVLIAASGTERAR
ncbi:MAG TPA: hypothetical protein VGL21_04905 [Jatrophihabitantaceae bacterium]